MKKLFSCILAILILAFSFVPCFAEEEEETPVETKKATLSVAANSTSVSKDDTITVGVRVSEGVYTISLTATYNSDCFSVTNVAKGSVFQFCEPSTGTPGKITCTAYDNDSESGGTIFTVTFKVKKPPAGNGATFSVSATGKSGDGSKVEISGASVTLKCAHKTIEKAEVKQTCTTNGKKGDRCTECGDFTTFELLPASHSLGDTWTPIANGMEERKCAACDYVERREQGSTEIPTPPVIVPDDEEPSTELPSYPYYEDLDVEPVTKPQKKPNNNGNYRPEQSDDEEKTEKKGLAALFSFASESSDSDKAAVLVVILAVVIVVVLAVYILLLNQRKKK